MKVNCYLSDINEFHKMNEFYEEVFGQTKPARTTFEVGKLPINAKYLLFEIFLKTFLKTYISSRIELDVIASF